MKYLKPSIANLSGFVAAIIIILVLFENASNRQGYLCPLNWFPKILQEHYSGVTLSALFGALVALVVSFVVSHVVERILQPRGDK